MEDNHMQQVLLPPEQPPPTYSQQQHHQQQQQQQQQSQQYPQLHPQLHHQQYQHSHQQQSIHGQASHSPLSIHLPSAPQHELPPIAGAHHEKTLPSLQSILAEAPAPPRTLQDRESGLTQPATQPWPSSNPYSTYHQPAYLSPSARPDHRMDSPGVMDLDVATPDSRRAASVLSMDDPDVRLAAEALGDLRAADFHSPPTRTNPPQNKPEPLLSLLTTSYPRSLGPIIDVSLSTYSASKNYSPVFRSSAEIVERGLTPVVNRAGTISRVTGVEGLVRWSLSGRRPPRHRHPSDLENGPMSKKRRKNNVGSGQESPEHGKEGIHEEFPGEVTGTYRPAPYSPRERRASNLSTVESLPAYDDHRSPSYEANDFDVSERALIPTTTEQSPTGSSTWQSRLMLSTSGLSVAMSEESLRSLKYCLGWLKWANAHIGKVIEALRSVLLEYDGSLKPHSLQNSEGETMQKGSGEWTIVVHTGGRDDLRSRIERLKGDILKSIKDVVDVVNKYAGGALPDNARTLVKRHLMALPARWAVATKSNKKAADGHVSSVRTYATTGSAGDDDGEEMKEGATRVLVLAKEGLDMMAQICGVLDGTIVSAEEWCERLGRRKRGETEEGAFPGDEDIGSVDSGGDVKMGL